jgi:hypothetical protein
MESEMGTLLIFESCSFSNLALHRAAVIADGADLAHHISETAGDSRSRSVGVSPLWVPQ